MKKVMEFFRDKTVAFYIALAFAVLSLITAIIYVAAISGLGEYFSIIPFLLVIVGVIAFVGLSILGSCRLGSAVLSVANFAAFIAYVATIYGFTIVQAMSVGSAADIKELPIIIVIGGLLFICALATNVTAWIRQRKTQKKKDKKGGDTVASGGNV